MIHLYSHFVGWCFKIRKLEFEFQLCTIQVDDLAEVIVCLSFPLCTVEMIIVLNF